MLAGLMSRWTTPVACTASIALAMGLRIAITSGGANMVERSSARSRSSPSSISIAR